jgi:hypothetical protein
MEKFATEELTIEQLTNEAMQLMTIDLDELYVVLGCQLIGAARPARVACLVGHQSALKHVIESRNGYGSLSSAADLTEWGREFHSIYDELKRDGVRFLSAVREELRAGLCIKEILELGNEITSAGMQIIVLIIAAILKLPRQIEAVSATVAAIICKSGVREFYVSQ